MRQRRIVVQGTLALAAGLAVAACEDSTGLDSLDDGLLLDMAIAAADATLEDVGTWAMPFAFYEPGRGRRCGRARSVRRPTRHR